MNDTAIRVSQLGKKYRLGTRRPGRRLSEIITSGLMPPWHIERQKELKSSLWALEDVSFAIGTNEIVGIIGRNGSGKSTLLKILAGVTEPTTGRAVIEGRSASLLEVGTGFHPDLTGRENIYLNAAILGMRRSEIDRKFEAIVDFSEIGRFIDTPVKRYSSGMTVRLAFSVAAHLDAEVLLVDEVLAVGDLKFQRKCMDSMDNSVQSGRTILLVSHQMSSIRRLCHRCIWLENGSIRMIGPTARVVAAYESDCLTSASKDPQSLPGNQRTQFLNWKIADNEPSEAHMLRTEGPFTLSVLAHINKSLDNADHALLLRNASGELIWGWETRGLRLPSGLNQLTYSFNSMPLKPGSYRWDTSLWSDGRRLDETSLVPDLIIDTTPHGHPHDAWAGVVNIPCRFAHSSVLVDSLQA